MTTELDNDAILDMALNAVAMFPEPFLHLAQAVIVQVEDRPSAEMLEEFGIEDPLDLTGLYDGTPLTEKMTTDTVPYPDKVWLFRLPILDEWRERRIALRDLVAHVTVHEFAHHFGWSDADIARIDRWWE